MKYCARCLYPENARPAIIFDDDGICSGCRYHESRQNVDWDKRKVLLEQVLEQYKKKARDKNSPYDCIIPVGGGKDSSFQTYLLKEVYGMRPLLVAWNHCFNTWVGNRNLSNLVEKSGCDLVRVSCNPASAHKIARYMLLKVGDITWHYHAGIRTVPFQVAARYKIPLVVLGEHGYAELTGMFTIDDLVEHTKWSRQEHDMRGLEPEDLIKENSDITIHDVGPYIYPSDEEIEAVGVRGIYLSNFINWSAKYQGELVINKWNFMPFGSKRQRTFNLYAKIEDHANDVHDYLKYLKFGYGRATDDASYEIRHGRMTREEGIKMVKEYDSNRPKSLDFYLETLNVSEKQFFDMVEPMRDLSIWEKDSKTGVWRVKDCVSNHADDPRVESARVPLAPEEQRTFHPNNSHLFYSEHTKPNEATQHDTVHYHVM